MANPTNRQLWDLGVPLDSAWLEYASADARRRHSELLTLAKFNEHAKAINIQSGLEALNLYSSGLQQWSQRREFENELREWLLEELFNDQLQAYAYRVSPSRSRSTVRIAAELFEHDPNWQSESLQARGIEYTEIRVVDPSRMVGFQKHRTGRKGSADAIRKAIAVLQSEGVDLCGIDRGSACEAIIRKLGKSHPKGSGLSNQNLAKYILEVCPKRRINI